MSGPEATKDWQLTQDDAYLQMWVDRLGQPPLMWVSQFVQLINAMATTEQWDSVSVNDIGCCVGASIWGIDELGAVNFDYAGFDISETYLSMARQHFPQRTFARLDIADDVPRRADVTVMSATLEHVENWRAALANLFVSTGRLALVRTFLGLSHEFAYCHRPGAQMPYPIMQFTFQEMYEIADEHGFSVDMIRDLATDSIPKYLGSGITRTQYVCRFTRKS